MTLISYKGPRPKDVITKYGRCLELIPTDKRFNEISVGLYVKNSVFTIWSFSTKPGVEKRIEEIRDLLVSLGGMSPISGTHNQAKFDCGLIHNRPVRFLLSQAVGKDPESMSAADFDNDGDEDLVVSVIGDISSERELQVIRNDSSTTILLVADQIAGSSYSPEMVEYGDFDADGLLDIVSIIEMAPLGMHDSPGIGVFLNSTTVAVRRAFG